MSKKTFAGFLCSYIYSTYIFFLNIIWILFAAKLKNSKNYLILVLNTCLSYLEINTFYLFIYFLVLYFISAFVM